MRPSIDRFSDEAAHGHAGCETKSLQTESAIPRTCILVPSASCGVLPTHTDLDASQSLAVIAGCDRLPPQSVHPAVRRVVVAVILHATSACSCFHPPLFLARLDLWLGLGLGLDVGLGVRFGLGFGTRLLLRLGTLAGRLLLHLI